MKFVKHSLQLFLCISINFDIFAIDEKPIVVLICSYNGAPWVTKNLDSVFNQKYKNFRVIYVDDCSTDNTAQLVKDYVVYHKLRDKVKLIVNNEQRIKLENTYNAVHSCKDEEIIIQLDYDDWFAHNTVFKEINQAYSDHDIWLTYGQYIEYPSKNIGISKRTPKYIINNLAFRNSWHYMHPKTFYAWLFKLIKKDDLIAHDIPGYENKFYPYADDLAEMYPMLEMAKDHFKFMPKIAYVYNRQNPISWQHVPEKRELLRLCQEEIKTRKKYKPLKNRISS